jgi:hypothetical protein
VGILRVVLIKGTINQSGPKYVHGYYHVYMYAHDKRIWPTENFIKSICKVESDVEVEQGH